MPDPSKTLNETNKRLQKDEASSAKTTYDTSKKDKKTGATTNYDRALSINSADQIMQVTEKALSASNYLVTNINARSGVESDYVEKLTVNSLSGIEGIPYQFLPSVDRRIDFSQSRALDTKDSFLEYKYLGRKYAEKIVAQMPLLFLAPCNPKFMEEGSFSNEDRGLILGAMVGAVNEVEELLKGSGRFYSAETAYYQYYNYLNVMLTCVVNFLGIGHEKIYINGKEQELWEVDWSQEMNPDFETTYRAKKNLVFYIDSIDSISESFSNSTMQSQVAGMINGFSDTAKELNYLFGTKDDSLIGNIKSAITGAGGTISNALSNVLGGQIGGNIVGSLLNNGLQSIVDGGKIIFPEMWSDSSYDKSYSITMKLRSPDNDSLSIFMNVLKPYCKILCMTLPHMIGSNVNAYRSPFICKAYCKGLFNIDLGMITSLNVTKGATCCWNDDGLPTQIDLDIEIKDLYSQLSMTGFVDDQYEEAGLISGIFKDTFKTPKQLANIVNNTAYMDFLANMAGLNINEMEWTRKVQTYYDLATNRLTNWPNEIVGGRVHQLMDEFMNKIYNIF